jgi:uncharacterized protein YdaU (DUF1376 family)
MPEHHENTQLRGEQFWVDRHMASELWMLPIAERGLHREMLSQAWLRGAQLPSDPEEIRRAIACSLVEWQRYWPRVSKHWVRRGRTLVNLVQRETYAKVLAAVQVAADRAKKGAAARWKSKKPKPPTKGKATKKRRPAKAPAQGHAQAHAQASAQAQGSGPMLKHVLEQCDLDLDQSVRTDLSTTPVQLAKYRRSTGAAAPACPPVENVNGEPDATEASPAGQVAAALRDRGGHAAARPLPGRFGGPRRGLLRVGRTDQNPPGAAAARIPAGPSGPHEGDARRAARLDETLRRAGDRAAARFQDVDRAPGDHPERGPTAAAGLSAGPFERLPVPSGDVEGAGIARLRALVQRVTAERSG